MKQIRLAVFDVDGTLIPHGACGLSAENAQALRALQEKGIPLVIASGRARYTAQSVLGDSVRFDYFAAANGCDVTDAGGDAIWRTTMTAEEMEALVRFFDENRIPLEFIFSDGYYAYVDYPAFFRKYRDESTATKGIAQFLRNGEDRTRHLRGMPFAACTTVPASLVKAFGEQNGALGLRFVPFAPDKYDILRAGVSKAVGVGHLLEHLGLAWEQVAVFGDGDNDVELFGRAGFSVAMGDGTPEIRALAGAVSAPAAEAGVARAICRYLL